VHLLSAIWHFRMDVADADYARVVTQYDRANSGEIAYEDLAGSLGLAADAIATARAA
jgi:hypothetical protein